MDMPIKFLIAYFFGDSMEIQNKTIITIIFVVLVIASIVYMAYFFLQPLIERYLLNLPNLSERNGVVDYSKLTNEQIQSSCPIKVAVLGDKPLLDSWGFLNKVVRRVTDERAFFIYKNNIKKETGLRSYQYKDGVISLIYYKNLKFTRVYVGNIVNNHLVVSRWAYNDNEVLSKISFQDLMNIDGSKFVLAHFFCQDKEKMADNYNIRKAIIQNNRIKYLLNEGTGYVDLNLIVQGDKIYFKEVIPEQVLGFVKENKIKIIPYFVDLSLQLDTKLFLERSILNNLPKGYDLQGYRALLKDINNGYIKGEGDERTIFKE